MSSATTPNSVQPLADALSGQVLVPGNPGYDEARRIQNGLIDKHPAVIARCLHTADVLRAVTFGRSQGLEISVRGGGHNVAGRAVTEGGLMIDLSLMKGIHVDPPRSTVRAQAGVTVSELGARAAAAWLVRRRRLRPQGFDPRAKPHPEVDPPKRMRVRRYLKGRQVDCRSSILGRCRSAQTTKVAISPNLSRVTRASARRS